MNMFFLLVLHYGNTSSVLFQEFFLRGSLCSTLKTGIILSLFKGKGAKANNKENYRGITLFPALYKIYKIILLNRLENLAFLDRGRPPEAVSPPKFGPTTIEKLELQTKFASQ